LDAYARCVRITRSDKSAAGRAALDPQKFVEPAERSLYAAVQQVPVATLQSVDALLNAVVPLIPFINTFFDQVLVMAEDKTVKDNRLGLLQQISDLANGIADLGKLEGF